MRGKMVVQKGASRARRHVKRRGEYQQLCVFARRAERRAVRQAIQAGKEEFDLGMACRVTARDVS